MGELSIWEWAVISIVLAPLIYVPLWFYCLTLQRALAAIDQGNRKLDPRTAWLLLIPFFNLIWIYFLVVNLKDGYDAMSAGGRLKSQSNAGFGIGIAMAVCWSLGLVPFVNLLTIIPSLVLWILHWRKVAEAGTLVIVQP
jgi:hypothetical protein